MKEADPEHGYGKCLCGHPAWLRNSRGEAAHPCCERAWRQYLRTIAQLELLLKAALSRSVPHFHCPACVASRSLQSRHPYVGEAPPHPQPANPRPEAYHR